MSAERAGQFTLRDLLVATAAIGLLCALIPSCVQESRIPGRRNTCQNNQHNISLAVLQFAEHHRHYPGYANTVGAKTTSYLVPLLPYLERNDIYQVWVASAGPDAPQDGADHNSLFVCPSNPPSDRRAASNAYVINAGQADAAAEAPPALLEANGIATNLTAADPAEISPQYVAKHDGLTNTLLITENLQAKSWALTDARQLYEGTTFLWWNRPPAGTKDFQINRGKSPNPAVPKLVYCRPSSNHNGGVVVSFCDGHTGFLAEDLDYDVYKQLMTPGGADSGDSVNRPLPADF